MQENADLKKKLQVAENQLAATHEEKTKAEERVHDIEKQMDESINLMKIKVK